MKFLAFSDVHGNKKSVNKLVKRAKKADIDFMLCGGDITMFGRGLKSILTEFNSVGKKMYIIPGNHEEPGKMSEEVLGFRNIFDLHGQSVKEGNYVILGYGGGGFAVHDSDFRKIAREWYSQYNGENIVLVTHGSPFGTKLDKLGDNYVGNKDYRNFIERIKPKVAISGHLHETAGVIDDIGKIKLVNPGWQGMVIELK